MRPTRLQAIDWLKIAHLLALLLFAALVALLDVRLIEQRGLQSELSQTINLANEVLREHALPRSAFYPPMVMYLILAVRAVGVTQINPYLFNFTFLAAGTVVAYKLAARVCSNIWIAFVATMLILLNPYFIWTILLSRDSSVEFFFLGVVLYLLVATCNLARSPTISGRIGLAASFVIASIVFSLVRVTGIFMVLSSILVAVWVIRHRFTRVLLAACAAAILGFALLWSYRNYKQAGAFVLATNGGYNLYLGNHPAFLHGYPHYDIDVFLASQGITPEHPVGEAERDAIYTRRALDFIREDPPAFLYRVIVKSAWYWLSIEKLPNYTTDASVVEAADGRHWIALLGPIQVLPGLAYAIYHLAYLPAFLASLIAILSKKVGSSIVVLFGPLIGLWPVVALTFPDTRFRLAAEAFSVPAIVGACVILWRLRREGVLSKTPATLAGGDEVGGG